MGQVNDQVAEYKKIYRTVYLLILGQCSPVLWAQLEGSKGYEKIKKQDLVEIFKFIKGLGCRHNLNIDKTYIVISSLKKYFTHIKSQS